LSGNTGFIAAKYLEKAKSIDEAPTTPKEQQTPALNRNSLTRSGNLKDPRDDRKPEEIIVTSDDKPRSKVTDRWSFKEMDISTSSNVKKGHISNGHSRDSSSDITSSAHSRGSSLDVSLFLFYFNFTGKIK